MPSGSGGGAKHTILVVDDNEDVADTARVVLEEFGYETIGASSGAAALQVLATEGHRIDALFSDIMMPGMNGLELAQQATAAYPTLKVILTSGYMGPELAAAMSSALYPTVPKPWLPSQLVTMVARALAEDGGS
jgi:CheY-like chemotaxis protein